MGDMDLERAQQMNILPTARIGNTSRDVYIHWLSRQMAEGRLDPAEHEARVSRMFEAKTRKEADYLIADLPPLMPERYEPQHRRDPHAWTPFQVVALVYGLALCLWMITVII